MNFPNVKQLAVEMLFFKKIYIFQALNIQAINEIHIFLLATVADTLQLPPAELLKFEQVGITKDAE